MPRSRGKGADDTIGQPWSELPELSVSDLSSVALGQREQRLDIRGAESVVVADRPDPASVAERQRRIEWRRSIDQPCVSSVRWIRATVRKVDVAQASISE